MEQNSEAIAGAIAGTNFIFNVVPSTKDKEAKEELKDMNNSFFDLIIIGGSLSGCFTAMSAAKTGAKVILIKERTYLGKEFAADLRPWIKSDLKENLNSKLKDILFDKIDDNQQSVGMWNEIPFFLGQFKKNLLARLC